MFEAPVGVRKWDSASWGWVVGFSEDSFRVWAQGALNMVARGELQWRPLECALRHVCYGKSHIMPVVPHGRDLHLLSFCAQRAGRWCGVALTFVPFSFRTASLAVSPQG